MRSRDCATQPSEDEIPGFFETRFHALREGQRYLVIVAQLLQVRVYSMSCSFYSRDAIPCNLALCYSNARVCCFPETRTRFDDRQCNAAVAAHPTRVRNKNYNQAHVQQMRILPMKACANNQALCRRQFFSKDVLSIQIFGTHPKSVSWSVGASVTQLNRLNHAFEHAALTSS